MIGVGASINNLHGSLSHVPVSPRYEAAAQSDLVDDTRLLDGREGACLPAALTYILYCREHSVSYLRQVQVTRPPGDLEITL